LIGRQFGQNKINAYMSNDQGVTFSRVATLDTYLGAGNNGGYCSFVKLDAKRILVTYYTDPTGAGKPNISASIMKFGGAPIQNQGKNV